MGTSLQEICRSSVTQLEFVDAETLVSSSSDGTTRVWSVATGAQKEELGETIGINTASLGLGVSAGIGFAIEGEATAAVTTSDSSTEQEVGKYSITFKDDLLLISEGQSLVAFFRAPHTITTIGRAGDRICVGCENGAVLHLRAAWIVPGLVEKLKASAEKENENAEAQRLAGDVVVLRLSGEPINVEHDITTTTVKFEGVSTVGAPETLVTSGVVYYEFEVLSIDGGAPQIGFALKDGLELSYTHLGVGCGNNDTSWALDGARQVKLFGGKKAKWPCRWGCGDVIGLAANVDAGKIAVSKNGNWSEEACGVVFEDDKIKQGVYSCLSGVDYSLRYAFKDFKYTVPSPDVWRGKASGVRSAPINQHFISLFHLI